MKRPNVNILYICVIFALITLFSCKGKGGTYRDGVFYPNDEKLAGSKKVTKPDGHEYIMFYNRDGTPQSGEGMHHPPVHLGGKEYIIVLPGRNVYMTKWINFFYGLMPPI